MRTRSGTLRLVISLAILLSGSTEASRCTNGWTLGVLEAVTGREYAQLSDGIQTIKAEVEPLSSYTVFRAQHELGRRGAIGLLGTSVFRDLNEPALQSYLTDRAVMLGVDGHVFLDHARNWVFHGGLAEPYMSLDKGPAPQLYDLEADVGETTDLAARELEVAGRRRGLAEKVRQDLGDALQARTGRNVRPAGVIQ